MSKTQVELLKRLIAADRAFQRNPADTNYRLIEVGFINGVSPSTATALVNAGLAIEDMPTWANERTNTHIRLA